MTPFYQHSRNVALVSVLVLLLSAIPLSQASSDVFNVLPRGSSSQQDPKAAQDIIHQVALLQNRLTTKGKERVLLQLQEAEAVSKVAEGGDMAIGAARLKKPKGYFSWSDDGRRSVIRLSDGAKARADRSRANITFDSYQQSTAVKDEERKVEKELESAAESMARSIYLGRGTKFAKKLLSSPSSFQLQNRGNVAAQPSWQLTWNPLRSHSRHTGYWTTYVVATSVDDEPIPQHTSVRMGIVDPSEKRVAFPTSFASEVYAFVPGAVAIPAHVDMAVKSFALPCSTKTQVIITTSNGLRHHLTPSDLVGTEIASVHGEGGEAMCLGTFYGLSLLDMDPEEAAFEALDEFLL